MRTFVFTNRVYPPVLGATGELLKDLAEGLAAGGDRVVVVTSRGHSARSSRPETMNGVEVIRVGTTTFTRASHRRRALSYLSFYPQLMWQVWKLGAVDAVISMTDPPLQVAAVTIASVRAKKRIHWAQDLYPELAEEVGVIPRGGLLARVLRGVSTRALRCQDKVVAVGRCMRERLVGRGIDAGKIEVIPNWSSVTPVSADKVKAMRERLGWNGKFIALYSGNIGLAHDFETLVGAAKLLGGSGVELVFAGEGPRLEEVRGRTKGMPHVSFLPSQPKEHLSEFLAAADVHVVSVRAGLQGLVVPSKVYGALSSGRPLIYVGSENSEVARTLGETGRGIVVRNRDAEGAAEALRKKMVTLGSGQRAHDAVDSSFAAALARWRDMLK